VKRVKKPSLRILDAEFSRFIRARDDHTCQRCGKSYPPGPSLHASHFIGRSNRATRWDPENVDAACNGCHTFWEARKATDYRDWKINQLGLARFLLLLDRSRETKKWTADELQELRKSWVVAVSS
jgi:NinG protein